MKTIQSQTCFFEKKQDANDKIATTYPLQSIRFIDLFAGLGGMRIGFEQAIKDFGQTAECVLTSEIKQTAINALQTNFEHKCLSGDVCKIDTKSIGDFDILLGGFPCQAFSTAGRGLGFLDTRGTLFFEVERIIRAKKPFGFVLENVEGLVTHDSGKTLKIIIQSLKNMGYKTNWSVLDSANYGLPQSRKRIYIVGTKTEFVELDLPHCTQTFVRDIREEGLPQLQTHFTKCLLKHYSTTQLQGKAIKDKRGGQNNIHSWDIELKGKVSKEQKVLLNKLFKERRKKHWSQQIGIDCMDGIPLTVQQISSFVDFANLKSMLDDLVDKGYLVKEHPKALRLSNNGKTKERVQDKTLPLGYNIVTGKLSFEFSKILDDNLVAPTLVATDVSKLGIVDGGGIRRLTLREGLRLFGYPDSYSLEYLKTKKQINDGFDLLGNTVAVPVIRYIAQRVIQAYLLYIKKQEFDNSIFDNCQSLVLSNS